MLSLIRDGCIIAKRRLPRVNQIEVGSFETSREEGARPLTTQDGAHFPYYSQLVPIRLSKDLNPDEFRLDITFPMP